MGGAIPRYGNILTASLGYPRAMATATDRAEWPALDVPKDIRQLINLFFTLAESKSEDAGSRLAKEVFAEEGLMVTPRGMSVGREGKLHLLL